MSKKIQAVRLSDKRKQKDRTWLIVGLILLGSFVFLSMFRKLDSDNALVTADATPVEASCSGLSMHPLVAYASGAGIQEGIDAAMEGTSPSCSR